jgi:hypothetical protein
MSQHPLSTWTERARDQKRIEALEAELAKANQSGQHLALAYEDALEALARAREWRELCLWAALAGATAMVLLMGYLT